MNKELNNQYHPSVCAGLHIILEENEAHLSFEEEHQLGTGSKSIDCLIIKKKPHVKIRKKLGQIFLGHNLIEIKGYGDSLSIDNYYRAVGYAFFYKADTGKENSIKIEDITLTFICTSMPINLLKHLKKVWGINCVKKWEGIYYLEGFLLPMQLIVASRLDTDENLWLRSSLIPVTKAEGDQLSKFYEKNKNKIYYEKVFHFISKKDAKVMKEVMSMRETMRFLFKEELEEKEREIEKKLELKITRELEQKISKELELKIIKELELKITRELELKAERKIAANFLKRGLSPDIVSEDTGLSMEEVLKLQKELLQAIQD